MMWARMRSPRAATSPAARRSRTAVPASPSPGEPRDSCRRSFSSRFPNCVRAYSRVRAAAEPSGTSERPPSSVSGQSAARGIRKNRGPSGCAWRVHGLGLCWQRGKQVHLALKWRTTKPRQDVNGKGFFRRDCAGSWLKMTIRNNVFKPAV